MTQNQARSGFGRSFLVEKILDTALAVEQTERWKQAIKTLNRQARLDSNWVPVIQNVSTTGDHQYNVQFINKHNPDDTRWIATTDPTFEHFKTFFNEQAQNLKEMFQVDSVTGKITAKTTSSNVSAGVGLGANKADLLKVIINWTAEGELYEKSDNPDLDTAVGVQSYLNLVQYSHGVVSEVAQVIAEIRPALKNGGAIAGEVAESLVSTIVKTAATEGLGALLNIANVVLDGIVLSKTSSTSERASATTTLVFDITSTTSSVLALGLGIAGASTASAILGAIAVPIAGLAAGIPTLVELYAQRTENAEKVAESFGTIAEGYAANSDGTRGMTYQAADQYRGTKSTLKPKGGAVITEIDLVRQQLTFGSQYLYQVNPEHPGRAHTKVGDRDSFLAGAGPDPGWQSNRGRNKQPLLSVREGLGCPETVQIQNADVIVLPRDIEIILDYKYGTVAPFYQELHSSPGINALHKIESTFYEKFYYDFHAGPDMAIDQFSSQYKPTTVAVKLDKARRTIVIPQVAEEKSYLTYKLEGHGGSYTVVLSEQNLNIRIKISDDADERWIFNIDRIGFRDHSTWLRPAGSWNLVFNDDGFTIGQTRAQTSFLPAAEPQRVRFEGRMPEQVVLCDNIGHIFMVNLQQKNMFLLLDITRNQNQSGYMDMNSRSLLYRAHVSYKYLKNSTASRIESVNNENVYVERGLGILETVPLINADNIAIIYEDSGKQYTGTWDPNNFALVAYCSDANGTDMQVDRNDNYDNIRETDVPQKLSFRGHFENVWTENNQIFFTEKMPQQGSQKPTVLQYCMYSGSGFYYIDAIDANSTLIDQILQQDYSALTLSKVDELLRQTNPNWTPYFQPGDPNRSYAYGKDTYTIIGKNSQDVGYQIKVHKDMGTSLSWKTELGIQSQVLPGPVLLLTGTQDSNTIVLPHFGGSYPPNYPHLAKSLKKAILFGQEGTDTYIVNTAIRDYEAIFILNYAKDITQDTLRLAGLNQQDFSYFQLGDDLVLFHTETGHWINIVGVFGTDQHYQHLQLQFQFSSLLVTEVPNHLHQLSANYIDLFINLEDVHFQRQGDNLVVLRQDKTDGIAYSNFYTTYTSLNYLQMFFRSTTGNSFLLNAEQLATLGSSGVNGQELVNAGSVQQFFDAIASCEAPSRSTVSKRGQDLVIGDEVYQNFFAQPAENQIVKMPLTLENAVIVQNNNSLMFVEITYTHIEDSPFGGQVARGSTKKTFCEFFNYYHYNHPDHAFGGDIKVQMPLSNGGSVVLSNATLTLFGWKTLRYLEQFKVNGFSFTYNDIDGRTMFMIRLDTDKQQVVAYQLGNQEIVRSSAQILSS